jgi:5'(3')-deoxyribonucleotidase
MQHHLFDKNICVLDCDGVLADFVTATIKAHGRHESHSEILSWDYFEDWGLSPAQFWEKCRGFDFWVNILPYRWAETLLSHLRSQYDEVVICTAPSNDPECLEAKLEWLNVNFGIGIGDVFIGRKKYLLAKPNHTLIDDNIDNCKAFVEHGGQAQLFTQPWNTNECFPDRFEVEPPRISNSQ